jgi:hypothetical protein
MTNDPNFDVEACNEQRKAFEQLLLEEPGTLIYLEDARDYLRWSLKTALKRFKRLELEIIPDPTDRRVKLVRLNDVLWVEEVFLASHQVNWANPYWYEEVRRLRNTDKDIAFSAPLSRSVGGYDHRHPNNLPEGLYQKQKALRDRRQARYSTYKRKEPLTDSK